MIKKLLILVLFVSIGFSVTSCGKKSEKDRLLKLYKLSTEFIQSDEYKKMMKDTNRTDMQQKMTDKQNDMLKKCDFPSIDSVQAIDMRYTEDPDIKNARALFDSVSRMVMQDLMKDMGIDPHQNMQQQPQDSNAPKTDNPPQSQEPKTK